MFKRNVSSRMSRALVCACSIVVLSVAFSGAAAGQQGWDKRTRVTFNGPVEIPGNGAQVLPAGTYVFRLMDSIADRHIVQILNAEESHVYATILAIPNQRLRATNDPVITFGERPAGEPPAIKAWFYPGDTTGQEFAYPKQRAVELAALANEPVLAIPNEAVANIVAPAPTAPTAPPVIALQEAPVTAVTPAGEEVALSAAVAAPPVQVAASLPKTASSLPLLALMGLLSVILGLSLKSLCAR